MAAHPWLRVGLEVEVSSPAECFRCALFAARVVSPCYDDDKKYLVEYETLATKEDGAPRPLREDVDMTLIRPRPPLENRIGFGCNDVVDARFNGGWWKGVVVKLLKKSRYMVRLECVNQSYQFQGAELRIHRNWVNGTWVPGFQKEVKQEQVDIQAKSYNVKQICNGTMLEKVFDRGSLVEVRIDEDGLRGAWFGATIIDLIGKDKYLIQFIDLGSETSDEYLREEVDARHLRPYPLESMAADGYSKQAKVEALYNDGWWEGIISKMLDSGRYLVYFHETEEEMVFDKSELRPHRDWINGKWMASSSIIKRKSQKTVQRDTKKRRCSSVR